MEMQEKKLKRFNVYAVIAKVLFIITIVLGSLGLIMGIAVEGLLIARGPELLDMFQEFIAGRGFDFVPQIDAIPHLTVISGIVSALIGLALAAYVFRAIWKMFRSIVETKTPFQSGTISRIRNIGIVMFIYAFVQAVLGRMMTHGMTEVFSRFSNTGGGDIKWAIIGFGILLLALAEMFEYGAGLQQDSSSIV